MMAPIMLSNTNLGYLSTYLHFSGFLEPIFTPNPDRAIFIAIERPKSPLPMTAIEYLSLLVSLESATKCNGPHFVLLIVGLPSLDEQLQMSSLLSWDVLNSDSGFMQTTLVNLTLLFRSSGIFSYMFLQIWANLWLSMYLD